MRKYNPRVLIICAILVCSLFVGVATGLGRPRLTEEQEANIETIIKHREKWKEYVDFVDRVPANRLHMAEISTDEGEVYTFLTVGYVKEDSRTGDETFVARGCLVRGDYFAYMNRAHQDWVFDCITIDLENMTDDELREVLRESYIAYLAKEK